MTNQDQEMELQKEELVAENGEHTRDRRVFVPRTDIFETNEAIFVVADMPGVDAEHLDITLEKNVLTLEGLVEPGWPEDYSLAYAEYEQGDYRRRFTISNEIDHDGIEANLKNGVLRLKLPKMQPTQKRITVSTS